MSTVESAFSFSQFKVVMGITTIDEPTYVLLLHTVFKHIKTFYTIDIDEENTLNYELVYAMYRHAKFLFDTHKGGLDILVSSADTSGNRNSFRDNLPKEIIEVYQAYSLEPPAYL